MFLVQKARACSNSSYISHPGSQPTYIPSGEFWKKSSTQKCLFLGRGYFFVPRSCIGLNWFTVNGSAAPCSPLPPRIAGGCKSYHFQVNLSRARVHATKSSKAPYHHSLFEKKRWKTCRFSWVSSTSFYGWVWWLRHNSLWNLVMGWTCHHVPGTIPWPCGSCFVKSHQVIPFVCVLTIFRDSVLFVLVFLP